MRILAALLLFLSVLTAPVRAADNCVSLEILATSIGEHIVLRGDAVTPFVDTYNAEPGAQITESVDSVIIATISEQNRAIAFFVVDNNVCHLLHMPLSVVRKLMAAA